MLRSPPSRTSNFNRFLIDFGSELVTPEPPKSLKFHWFYKHFLLCGLFKIRSNFDPILVPTYFRFPSQHPPNSLQKSILKGIDFLIDVRIDFYAVLPPTWNPLGPQVGAILALKNAQELPTTLSKTHLRAITRPDFQNESIMEPPTLQKDASDPPFWIDFGASFEDFVRTCSLRLFFNLGSILMSSCKSSAVAGTQPPSPDQ